jgi:hypothetical protein
MIADYSFIGKMPKKWGDPRIPTIPCTINNNYDCWLFIYVIWVLE